MTAQKLSSRAVRASARLGDPLLRQQVVNPLKCPFVTDVVVGSSAP